MQDFWFYYTTMSTQLPQWNIMKCMPNNIHFAQCSVTKCMPRNEVSYITRSFFGVIGVFESIVVTVTLYTHTDDRNVTNAIWTILHK